MANLIFQNNENTEISQKLNTKQKIAEKSVLGLKNEKYPRKSWYLDYFKIKLIIKNLRLIEFPAGLGTFRHCISQKTLHKIQENSDNHNRGKAREPNSAAAFCSRPQ